MMRPDIDLRIEELVRHGFDPADRYRIGVALERELARLFAEQGAPKSLMRGAELPTLSLGSFQVRQGAKPEVVGAQVAQAVYKGLNAGARQASHISAMHPALPGNTRKPPQTQGKGGSSR